jgi:hypothetical protein
VGTVIVESNILFYGHEVQELISQTLRMNSDFGVRFLGEKKVENKAREVFVVGLIFMPYPLI